MDEINDEFKETIIKYIKCDDMIIEKNSELKELREKKKIFEQYILKFLIEKDQNIINVGDDKIKRIDVKTRTTVPIKVEMLKEIISEVFENCKIKNGEEILEQIVNGIDEKRNEKHYNLKRIKPKK
jgi:hypothetical protein